MVEVGDKRIGNENFLGQKMINSQKLITLLLQLLIKITRYTYENVRNKQLYD